MDTYAELRAEVLKRFEGHDYSPDGPPVWAWWVHHDTLAEPLRGPIVERVDWIINHKPAHEIPTRLKWLYPVLSEVPPAIVEASAALDKARAAYDKASAAYERAWDAPGKARAVYDKARAALDKAWAAYNKARAAYEKALAAYGKDLTALLERELPGCPWDGTFLVFEDD
jgi:tetratricopeptide (TPR) repeat protein